MVYYGTPRLIAPSGDVTGATDVARINAGLAGGGSVQLAPAPLAAPYWINAPILPTTGCRLWGTQWWAASANDNYGAGVGASGGTVIQATGTFSGAAMINMDNQAVTQLYGADLAGFTLEGFSTSGLGCHGIQVNGAWGACFLRGVMVHRPDQDCLHMNLGGGNKVPDDWQVSECRFSGSRNGWGVNIANNLPDSWFDSCESSENQLGGWKVNWCDNTRWTSCKGENSIAGPGWQFTGNGVDHTCHLTGCSSNANAQDGFLFDNSVGGALGSYILTGCKSTADNQAAGAFSAFRSNGSKSRIMGTGCFAAGAKYGADEVASSYGMCFTGSWLAGTTAATHDDGSNTHALVNQSPVPF